MGQHHRRARADPADERPSTGRPTARIRRTASPTSCCCRRRARSSARARAATRSGWTRRGRRRSRSTSTGSTPTTATSGRTCAGSRSSRASGSRRSRRSRRARPRRRPAQRALALDITARTHGAEAAARAIADSEAKFSTEADRRPGCPRARCSSRPAGSRSTPDGARPGRGGPAGRGRGVRVEAARRAG